MNIRRGSPSFMSVQFFICELCYLNLQSLVWRRHVGAHLFYGINITEGNHQKHLLPQLALLRKHMNSSLEELLNIKVVLFLTQIATSSLREQRASKLSYLGERSESRENKRSRAACFARPNRRACSQAITSVIFNYFLKKHCQWLLA